MTEHKLHAPQHIPAPPVPSGRECPFCHSVGSIKSGACTSCNTSLPSAKSEYDKNKLLANGGRYRDRPKRSEPPWYVPSCSGIDGIDEAEEIETDADTELSGLDLPDDQDSDFDVEDQADLLPADEDLPWS